MVIHSGRTSKRSPIIHHLKYGFHLDAQYDVNLEKCALLKCLCGEWKRVCCRQAPVRSLALKHLRHFWSTDKSSLIHLSNRKGSTFICVHVRITTKRCAFKQTGCALGLMWTWARNFETPSLKNISICNTPSRVHTTTTRSCSERVANPRFRRGRAGALTRNAKGYSASFWGQGSEVYTQPLLAYIRYI